MKTYDWPRSGSPLTSVVIGTQDMTDDELLSTYLAERALRWGNSWVFRDPDLVPHQPRRAKETR